MTITPQQTKLLTEPLSRAYVKERSQAGRTFSYIEAWKAIEEANRIFGHDGWNRELLDLRLLGEPRLVDGKARVAYRATVRIHVGDTFRDGSGFGSGIDKDVDQAHESALKEAESDAMKRALMTFGNPFGLALYDKTQANVIDAPPESARIQRKSSAQATRDGDHTRYLDRVSAADAEGIARMEADFDLDTAAMPQSWLPPMMDKVILRKEELNPVDGAAELDHQYAETVR